MAEGSEASKQDVVEQLLREAKSGVAPTTPNPSSAAAKPAQPGSSVLRQDEIEALLNQNAASQPARPPAVPAAAPPAAAHPLRPARPASPASQSGDSGPGRIAQGDIDFLLSQAEQALASVQNPPRDTAGDSALPFRLTDFSGAAPTAESATLDLIRDVDLDLRIELGRTHMHLEDVLKLGKGAVVPLDKLAGDPVDIYANGRLIARGEVLILNDNFCVRVAELVVGDAAPAS
ncbi:MAG TPA: flagellar motor switch protein FliN [Pirellulales bacterium]|nr:flagellar motor switch protein FliN [Pirellulales bacterium]